MNLLEVLRERIKVMAIIEHQEPGLVTKGVEEYRQARLRMLNSLISNHLKSLDHGNDTKNEASDRQACVDRPHNKERSGNTERSMGALEFEKAGAEKGRRLCGW